LTIVMAYATDPVGTGFVASLAHPGGNTTGLAGSSDDTSPKQLELLAAIVTNPSRIGLLGNPDNPAYSPVRNGAQDAAKKAGLSLLTVEARNLQEIENAFAAFAKEHVQAVMVATDAVFLGQQQRLAQFALTNRLPTMFSQREYVEAGGLMSYGESLFDFFRRAASFVDKIIKGAKPGDLPIEQPTKFHLVINRKTADALGVTIPAQLYIFADEDRVAALFCCGASVRFWHKADRARDLATCPLSGVERTSANVGARSAGGFAPSIIIICPSSCPSVNSPVDTRNARRS